MTQKEIAKDYKRAFLCYGHILYPEEMKIRAREILDSRIVIIEGI